MHRHMHIHSNLLSCCFGRVETPKVIMKLNYNSLGSGVEMRSHVSVLPEAVKCSEIAEALAGNACHDS